MLTGFRAARFRCACRLFRPAGERAPSALEKGIIDRSPPSLHQYWNCLQRPSITQVVIEDAIAGSALIRSKTPSSFAFVFNESYRIFRIATDQLEAIRP
jgi:hypothetical protein